ncbi:hypothetical protein SLA2020_017830 [Shorea laevis]
MEISTHLFYKISINSPCKNNSCSGNLKTLLASVNNISFVTPTTNIFQAYYYGILGVFGTDSRSFPSLFYDFTAPDLPMDLEFPKLGTEAKILHYNSTVELVF